MSFTGSIKEEVCNLRTTKTDEISDGKECNRATRGN